MKTKFTALLLLLTMAKVYCQPHVLPIEADSILIKNLINQINELKEQNKSNSNNINILLGIKDLDSRVKYNIVKENLQNSSKSYKMLSDKINTLKSKQSNDQLDSFIKNLNSPQSSELNFKFDEIIKKLVIENIQPKKNNFSNKLVETIDNITKSPILTSIPTISPAIGISNAVIGLLRSAGINNKEVDNKKIEAFENALNKYIQYYSALNEADTYLQSSLTVQINELNILHQKLENHVVFIANTLNFPTPTRGKEEKISDFLNRLFISFNDGYINKILSDSENKNTENGKLNLDRILLSNNGNLKTANNSLGEFIALSNQFEFQYNNYLGILDLYHSKILNSFEIANKNEIIDSKLLEQIKNKFLSLKESAKNDFVTNVNIEELLLKNQAIKYTATIL